MLKGKKRERKAISGTWQCQQPLPAMNRGSHPRARTSAQDAPPFRRPLAALLTSLGSLFSPLGWFFHLATADTAATLHLPSIPLHAPLVELGWRQRGRPLEPNDLVSPRFNGEIRCCRDNGRSAPEVKDNEGGLRRQGSVLASVRDAGPVLCAAVFYQSATWRVAPSLCNHSEYVE